MDLSWWMLASALCTAAGAGLVYFVMQSRTEVMLAKQREDLAAANAALGVHREVMQDSIRFAEESGRRKALDDFIGDIRIEERHYVRENKALFLRRRSIVRQERLFFRNLPLSNWIEQEMPFEEGADVEALAKTMAVFAPELMAIPDLRNDQPRRLLRN
jgi:hypothetical protein